MKKLIVVAVLLLAVTSCAAGIKGKSDYDIQGYASSNLTDNK